MIRSFALLLLISGLLGVGFAPSAEACTVIIPMPWPGETFEQAAVRVERDEQRGLMAQSDAIYLARSSLDAATRTAHLTTLAGLSGARPPRTSLIRDRESCGGWSGPRGSVVVFARRIGMSDAPWRPWRWGRWVVIGWRPASEVVEPVLIDSLRAARIRLEAKRG